MFYGLEEKEVVSIAERLKEREPRMREMQVGLPQGKLLV